MARILFVIVLLLGLGYVVLNLKNTVHNPITVLPPTPTIQVTPLPTESAKQIVVHDKKVSYLIIPPAKGTTITLGSNLPQKQGASEIKEKNTCKSLINGGFYDTNNHHLGLFLVNDIVTQALSKNALFNGLFWSTQNGSVGIGDSLPDTTLRFALQTGPILLLNGKPQVLHILQDEGARRMIAFTITQEEVAFATIFDDENMYLGPLLGDVPEIAFAISQKEGWNNVSAINLDGGNHSAFLTTTRSIDELSPIGSYFCIR